MIKHQLEAVGFCPPFLLVANWYEIWQIRGASDYPLAGGTRHHRVGKIHQTRTHGGKLERL